MTTDHMKEPLPPANRPHKSTKDVTKAFAEISAKTPVDEAFRSAFLQNKLLIAQTHPTNEQPGQSDRLSESSTRIETDGKLAGQGRHCAV